MRTKNSGLLIWLKGATEADIQRTGTTKAYLKQIGYGHKFASPEIAVRTELASYGVVTRRQLRPDDWQQIWPELATV